MNTVFEFRKNDNWVQSPAFISASGGTESTSGDYKIHTFTSSGTFTVTQAAIGKPTAESAVDYIIVAGGGAGATPGGNSGGGGGGGGVRASAVTYSNGGPSSPRTSGVDGVAVTAQAYSIVVGAGSAAKSYPSPNPGTMRGTDSSALGLTATGGGDGGHNAGGGNPGNSGGSGGGASGGGYNKTAGAGNTPSVSPAQGSDGGARPGSGGDGGGAGGGGFMVAGSNANTGSVAPGGAGGGFPNAMGTSGQNCGSYYYFAGGGAGGGNDPGSSPRGGGLGGGGDTGGAYNAPCAERAGAPGTANTGGGGGGPNNGTQVAGGAGGPGIVILRYKYQ
jgi:hypothetical protein